MGQLFCYHCSNASALTSQLQAPLGKYLYDRQTKDAFASPKENDSFHVKFHVDFTDCFTNFLLLYLEAWKLLNIYIPAQLNQSCSISLALYVYVGIFQLLLKSINFPSQ